MSSAAQAVRDFADEYGITLMNDAQAALSPRLRHLHQTILAAFVDSGAAPTTAWITDSPAPQPLTQHLLKDPQP